MRLVTVVNRLANETLEGCWDGKHFLLPPGKSAIDEQRARAIKLQNPIKGSDDSLTGNLQYYVGIEEDGDDCSPVEKSTEIELYKSLRSKAIPVVIVPGKAGMYAGDFSRMPIAGGTVDGSFAKP